MQEDEPATFYLTDFLARHFDTLVVRALKLDMHPELNEIVFGNYERLVYLAQTDDARARGARARGGAAFLGLASSACGRATASSSRRSPASWTVCRA